MSEQKIDYYRARKSDETVAEFVGRVGKNLDYEYGGILDQLPSVEALFDYYALFSVDYGTDFWAGVVECIGEGDDPAKAIAFVKRWKLGAGWRQDIQRAVSVAKHAKAGKS